MASGMSVRGNSGEHPRVKVYVIDPKKFQEVGKPVVTTEKTSGLGHELPKRRILPAAAKENRKEQDDDEELISHLKKPRTTRAGRVTKPTRIEHVTGVGVTIAGASGGSASLPVKVRRREPPEFFRCQTCQKFYLGYAKLKSHLKKFSTHLGSPEYLKSIAPTPTRRPSHSVAVQAEQCQVIAEVTNHLPGTSVLEESTQTTSIGAIETRGGETFETMPGDLSDSNSLTIGVPPIPTFSEVQEGLSAGPSPSSSSLPFWNVFSNFSNTSRDEGSPCGSESTGLGVVRKEDGTTVSELSTSTGSQIRTVWDMVEKKLFQNGINHMLLELSDVAEKLGKIARDKIIPIREDEEERLPSFTPIVRVENPFLSHLLDLPFGTYVFREDGGTRRPPLPPPTTDLSLTAGEVDIDKFLACNEMDLSLPHLTNLDIAAICNN